MTESVKIWIFIFLGIIILFSFLTWFLCSGGDDCNDKKDNDNNKSPHNWQRDNNKNNNDFKSSYTNNISVIYTDKSKKITPLSDFDK